MKSSLVRGNAIAALGYLQGQQVTDLLLKLLTDRRRPLIDRLQIARILSATIDDKGAERLQALDLETEPNEQQFGVEMILERHRLRRRYSDT